MGLDDTIKKILKSINTEPRMLIQALLGGRMSGPEIARRIREYAGDVWSPDNSKVIQACRKLSELGALHEKTNKHRKEREAIYTFRTMDGTYKALAALGLRTAADYDFSFYKIFKCSANPDDEESNILLKVYKILLNFEGTETAASLSKKIGFSSTWNAINWLEEAGLIRIDGEDKTEYRYSLGSRRFWLFQTSQIKLEKLVSDIERFANTKGEFTFNQLWDHLSRKPGYSSKHSQERARHALNKLYERGYLKREGDIGAFELTLKQTGENIRGKFILPMDQLLRKETTRQNIYALAGKIDSEVVQKSLAAYAKAEEHIATSK